MKVLIHDERDIKLHTIEIDFRKLVSEAESKLSDGDPIQQVSNLIIKQIESKGFEVHPDNLNDITVEISRFLSNGEDPPSLKVMVKDTLKSREENTDIDIASLGISNLFELPLSYPNEDMRRRYEALIGLDHVKERLKKEAILLLSKENLEKWSKKFHNGKILSACRGFETRCPFIIFGGDVGTGKTELAETIGDPISRLLTNNVLLLRMSIETRGGGIVGEMTKLIKKAFQETQEIANRANCPIIFLLDEADALAQSREAIQMHHEDKAGVNALIQGIDRLRISKVPILVIFCTNRLEALDPAIERRAAIIYKFTRPDEQQRKDIFNKFFGELKLQPKQINDLVELTGSAKDRSYGYTFSDLINRLIPNAVLEAFPNKPLDFECILNALKETTPTTPFK